MALTDTALRLIKPGPKSRKVTDEKALYIEVAPGGGKWWRLKHRVHGKEKRISQLRGRPRSFETCLCEDVI